MFLQKCKEYFGGELIGSDENGELDKGIVYFMIEGTKSPSHAIKSSPEITMLFGLEISYLNALIPRSNRSGTNFYFTF